MVKIDLSKLSEQVSHILMLRGSSLAPLCLGDHTHPQANDIIESIPDDKLFSVAQVSDTDMAVAIRSLLYVRCGWLAEGSMFAMMAPKIESEYICGFVERNLGHADRAKAHFHKVTDHPVFETLHQETLQLLSNSMDKRLKRFHGILKVHGSWEPYAFIDVYEEARTGEMSSASQETVQLIQANEFNALFLYCYKQLLGVNAQKIEQPNPEDAPRKRPTPPPRPKASFETRTTKRAEKPGKDTAPTKTQSNDVRIGCPKCKTIQTFDASKRGQKAHCNKCSVGFTIPGGKTAAPATATREAAVRVACPKCRTAAAYPQAKRGTKVNCGKCGTAYNIPNRAAA